MFKLRGKRLLFCKPCAGPDREWHDAVVDDVQERHLAELLPGDEAKLKKQTGQYGK